MKPIKLTMQAFGPYATRESVDFREAMNSGLFAIYGQTGSGKSTIFSAMTFALFGEAAKAEQDIMSLRSDHAEVGLLTEVEFIFDLGDKRYVIRRRPEQQRPKERGVGETRLAHEAFLFDATGLAPDEITETNSGTVLAEKKVGHVKDAMTEILGYGADQFRQIILLPQGRFEAFLAAKTDARLSILRDLFDVSLYRRLAARLKEQGQAAEREVVQEREVCNRRVKAEGFETIDALEEGIVAADQAVSRDIEVEAEAAAACKMAKDSLDAANQIGMRFADADAKEAAVTDLLAQQTEMEGLQKSVENAKRAQAILDVEGHWRESQKELENASKRTGSSNKLMGEAAAKVTGAERIHAIESARSAETEQLRTEIGGLEHHLKTLEGATVIRAEVVAALTALDLRTQGFHKAETHLKALSAKRVADESALTTSRQAEGDRGRISAHLATVQTELKDAVGFEAAKTSAAAATETRDLRQADHRKALAKVDEAKDLFEIAEGNLSATQALHLAASLLPGAECPVCGSTQHPHLATGEIAATGLDNAFREAKRVWEVTQVAERAAGQELAAAMATLAERTGVISGLKVPEKSSSSLRNEVADLQTSIQALGPVTDIAGLEADLATLAKSIEGAELERDQARANRDAANESHTVVQDRLTQALATVPLDLQIEVSLKAKLAATQALLTARLEEVKRAEAALQVAREAAVAAKTATEAAVEAETLCQTRCQQTLSVYRARLAAAGMEEAQFIALKPFIERIETDAAQVAQYNQQMAIAQSQAQIAREAVVGAERIDLGPLQVAAPELEAAHQQAATIRIQADMTLAALRKVQDEVEGALAKLQKIEQDSAPLRQLAALFNAENIQRIDLETFAIGAMFDQVLEAANLRLHPMTAGRYTLDREHEGTGGRARRGLGIRVNDAHTGRGRSPTTLSGGETFICALALALGLSDVVESDNGKVRLDTIFIDEGFGSLDTENDSGTLDQVLQVLANLVGQRRSVGLISHVPLVQEVIPNGFYVRKTSRGSTIELRGDI